ncbi:BACON domain-containing carbohydrate-binding protein [uncultured Parabacteroides sp.]|uniref:BACON domain-containing protein n=1 Tax=uncultured Parabacteroides sp. TaxID=512312 RepID=UPI002589E6ED|nr:BACON domain-containing carbohydrate-binding protein [uncultured Parabacteroides sp.]
MKKMNKLYILLACVFSLLCGCSDDMVKDQLLGSGMKDVDVCFNFTLSGEVTPVTRSVAFTSEEDEMGTMSSEIISEIAEVATKASGVDESLVKTLWLGQYDASGNLLISHYLTDVTGNEIQVQLKESPDCFLRFVGNAGNLGKVATLTAFNETKIDYTTGTGGLTTSEGLPVNLSCANIAQLDNQSISINYKQSVVLSRMLTKVQLNYTIKSGFSFTPKRLSLYDVPTQIQCMEPAGQVIGTAYQVFTKTIPAGTSASFSWYMPENMAGVITNGKDGYATSAREKRGSSASVPHATYIELVGDATINRTTYADVSFRIYPGNDFNDYNLKRNTPYVVNLTLSGIDLSDPRVSVTVPDMVAPADIDAAVNSTTTIQATARPGAAWTITLPDWLSALVDGKTNGAAGGALNFNGPAPVKFTAVTANPSSTERSQSFTIAGKSVTVKQKGSVLSATSKNKTIGPEGIPHSDTEYSFSATEGLSWALSEAIDWLTLTGTTTGVVSNATTTPTVSYTVTVNPNASTRTGYLFVKVGNAISGTDAALEKQIAAITQQPSNITVPANGGTIPAVGGNITVSGITATEGLQWTVTKKSGFTDFSFSGIDVANGKFVVTAKQSATVARSAVFTLSVTGAEPARTFDITISQPKNGNNYVPGTTSLMVSKAQRGNGWYRGNGNEARPYCNNLSDLGYSDWRLPSKNELMAIYNGKSEIGNVSLSGKYWADNGDTPPWAPYVNMNNGATGNNSWNDNSNNVLCVRGTY